MADHLQDQLRRFRPELPLERAQTIPASWYRDPKIDAAERGAVFATTWQAVGRVDQVAEPGAYFTADLAGEPILVVRGSDGQLRAFYNVCRHRAAYVMPEAQGQASSSSSGTISTSGYRLVRRE